MGNLSDSLQTKGFYQTQGTTTALGKMTIGSTIIKTIVGMTEKENGKKPEDQNVDQTLELTEKEARTEPGQHHGKTSRKYRRFWGVSEDEESPARLGRHMQGR
jgi:hypothetical protein